MTAPPATSPRSASTASTDHQDDPDDAVDAEPTREAPADGGRPPLRSSSRLPWALAAIGLLGTLVFGIAWLGARGDDGGGSSATAGSPSEMLKSARAFSEDLTNFDGQSIDADFDAITARSTGEFRSQADQFFSTDVRKQLKEAQASSRGEIRSAFVQEQDGDRGTVFVVMDQTIANNQSPQPQADTLRMELALVFEDGQWLVERVSVLTAPAGATATPPGTEEGD